MDVEYEDPDLSIKPDLGGSATDDTIADFNFDPASFDGLFSTMAPTRDEPPPRAVPDPSSFAMAVDFLSKGLYDRASAEINRAISRGNDRAEGSALLGDVYAKQGLFGEALDRYQEALRLRPHLRGAVVGQIRSLLHLGRAAEARPAAKRLLAEEPRDCDVILLAATACAETGDPAEALSLLDAARRVAPMRADVRSKIADIARSLGDLDGAIAAYRDALQLDPDLAVVRYRLAQLLQAKGQTREAEVELTTAIDTVPTYADAILELATLRRRLGYPDEAVTLLVELLPHDPYHLDALIALGEALVAVGRDADAAQAFARVLRFDPTHVAALFHIGLLLADRHRYRDAVACWERVVDLAPATDFGRRARREIRTATELGRIFAHRAAG
jgi:tetratricopeptide (TPR) repeat protein